MRQFLPILLSLFSLAGCGAPSAPENGYLQISTSEAITMMEEESGYIILDVRTPEEFREQARIFIQRLVEKVREEKRRRRSDDLANVRT